jgi:succinate dehydrogenase hydrophobic anchor subunit
VLAVHLCVGSKSLLKDLEIDRRYKTAFRIVVCVFAAAFALSGIAGLFIG